MYNNVIAILMLIFTFSLPRYLFYGSPYSLSRINFNRKNKTGNKFKINMATFSIAINYLKKETFLYGTNYNGKFIVISMDYDGRHNKTILETTVKIEAFGVFGEMQYWKKSNASVINVINVTTNGIYRNVSLARRWSSLTGLAVINYLPNPICKLWFIFIYFFCEWYK